MGSALACGPCHRGAAGRDDLQRQGFPLKPSHRDHSRGGGSGGGARGRAGGEGRRGGGRGGRRRATFRPQRAAGGAAAAACGGGGGPRGLRGPHRGGASRHCRRRAGHRRSGADHAQDVRGRPPRPTLCERPSCNRAPRAAACPEGRGTGRRSAAHRAKGGRGVGGRGVGKGGCEDSGGGGEDKLEGPGAALVYSRGSDGGSPDDDR
mmetsp:Transcript_116940/g.291828  ORF Transcript_116940/g.291828 Transcript_116940/m.291828 type:complete len:207 (-) Transcript_116940:968-1588(-)